MGVLDITYGEDLLSVANFLEIVKGEIRATGGETKSPIGYKVKIGKYIICHGDIKKDSEFYEIPRLPVSFYKDKPKISSKELLDWFIQRYVDPEYIEEFYSWNPTVYTSRWKSPDKENMISQTIEIHESGSQFHETLFQIQLKVK